MWVTASDDPQSVPGPPMPSASWQRVFSPGTASWGLYSKTASSPRKRGPISRASGKMHRRAFGSCWRWVPAFAGMTRKVARWTHGRRRRSARTEFTGNVGFDPLSFRACALNIPPAPSGNVPSCRLTRRCENASSIHHPESRPDRVGTAEIRHFLRQPKGWMRLSRHSFANLMVGPNGQL